MTDKTRAGRIEDTRLVTGAGRYTDDLAHDGALWAAFVRAPHAAARVTSLDVTEAREMPGVVAVLTAEDLAKDGVGPVQADAAVTGPDGRAWSATPRPLLVTDRVRHLGEPLAICIAETRMQAMDAAEAVLADLEDMPAVSSVAEARQADASLVHEDCPGNLGLQWGRGDWEAAEAAIAAADHQVTLRAPVTRVTAVAMEPRTALAVPEDGRMNFFVSHQNPPAFRTALAKAFAMDETAIRVVAGDVGGAFGMKSGPLREEMLVFWAAHRLGRAVRWRADRSEDFLTDEAGRDVMVEARLGLSSDGTFQAMTFAMTQDLGAYMSARSMPMVTNFGGVAGVYRTPVIAGRIDGILTNTVPVAPYRGAGRPEATFAVEQLIDKAARQLDLDRVELRRRNLIGEHEMPWTSPFFYDYDCGAFEKVMDAGLGLADTAGFEERRDRSEASGKLRGLGIALCIETAGGIYGRAGFDWTDLELHADGTVTLGAGAFSAGQGLETSMTQLAARALELPADRISYVQGDTDIVARGAGMGGSGAMVKGGSALLVAAKELIGKAKGVAAGALEADVADIDYSDGLFRVTGTNKSIALDDVARRAGETSVRLVGNGEFKADMPTFPNGCHVCEVEIDPQTGEVAILGYAAVEDIGHVMNRQLAEGQIQGGVGQALGQIFLEKLEYSAGDGQLVTGSFMDYAMPRAVDFPAFLTDFLEVPTEKNPLGVKGVGEAGSVGALAAGMNAVSDAMAHAGVDQFDMPATPGRIWAALKAADAAWSTTRD